VLTHIYTSVDVPTTDSETASAAHLTPFTDAYGCTFSITTFTIGSSTFEQGIPPYECTNGSPAASSAQPTYTDDPCKSYCAAADTLISRYGYTDDLCSSSFQQQSDTCFDCIDNDRDNNYATQNYRDRMQKGLDHCEKSRVSSSTIAGAVIGGCGGMILICIGTWMLGRKLQSRQHEWKKRQIRVVGARPMREIQVGIAELGPESGSKQRLELDGRLVPWELDGNGAPDDEKKWRVRELAALVELPANEEVQRPRRNDA
jgi:hypothetical protein